MTTHYIITTPEGWRENPTGFTYEGVQHPASVWRKWDDEALKAIGAYRLEMPEPPEGKQLASYTIEGARTPKLVPVWEDIPPEPEPFHEITTMAFIERFTDEEDFLINQTAMAQAAEGDFTLYNMWRRLNRSTTVWLEDPEVVAGVNGLESSNLLGPGRAAEILTP